MAGSGSGAGRLDGVFVAALAAAGGTPPGRGVQGDITGFRVAWRPLARIGPAFAAGKGGSGVPVIEFQPLGVRVDVKSGTSILDGARLIGRDLGEWGIGSTCGGQGTCGRCRVRVAGGPISGLDEGEVELLARRGGDPSHRLACRAMVLGDVKVFLDRVEQGGRLQVAGRLRRMAAKPAVRAIPFKLELPVVGDRIGDTDRFRVFLAEACRQPVHGRANSPAPVSVTIDDEVLRGLSPLLWKSGFEGWAVLRQEPDSGSGPGRAGDHDRAHGPAHAPAGDPAHGPARGQAGGSARGPARGQAGGSARDAEVIEVLSRGDPPPLLGLAVDLGTTKIAAYLVDLSTGDILRSGARLNPQISFGEDVISRMQYASRSVEDYRRIRRVAVEAINELAAELARQAGRLTADIRDAVIGGNTAMHHILLGLGLDRLASAPHVPALTGALDIKARELGLALAQGAYVHLLPCIAGYVGGDHVAVLLATALPDDTGVAMAVDVGTNTEIALSRRGEVTCCSCASGPAFEGGHVSHGMRALNGAVDRVWLEGGRVRFSVIGGGEPVGFSGAAAIDLLAVLLETGAMDNTGRLRRGAAGVEEGEGGLRFVLGDVPFSQGDIRELQLAKAAVRSGIEGLLRTAGLEAGAIDRFYLAGAFGVALNPEKAMAIGMLPRLPLDRFVPVGNAAGMGTNLALISVDARRAAARIAAEAGYLELVSLPGYQDLYVSQLGFPQEK